MINNFRLSSWVDFIDIMGSRFSHCQHCSLRLYGCNVLKLNLTIQNEPKVVYICKSCREPYMTAIKQSVIIAGFDQFIQQLKIQVVAEVNKQKLSKI